MLVEGGREVPVLLARHIRVGGESVLGARQVNLLPWGSPWAVRLPALVIGPPGAPLLLLIWGIAGSPTPVLLPTPRWLLHLRTESPPLLLT
jgi:hypothetical protein